MKILLYTDSRGLSDHDRKARKGINIPKTYRHYGDRLQDHHDVEKHLAPFSWTTTLEFLRHYDSVEASDYDAVILHTGVVEYAPRRKKSCSAIYDNNKEYYDLIFGEKIIREHLNGDFGYPYKGDVAINMYSLDMAKNSLLPRLKQIPNLVWISCNRILSTWNGEVEHAKERPPNIFDIVEDYTELFIEELEYVVDVLKWDEDEVRKYTHENVHLNESGSDYVYYELVKILKNFV